MKLMKLLLAAALLRCGMLAAAADWNPADVFGVNHVDGKYYLTGQDYLNEGAGEVLATGSKVLKLYLNPGSYRWNSDWPGHLDSLVAVAEAPYFKAVFAQPFRTFILTAYARGRDDHYWTDGVSAAEAAGETRQFYDLTKYLLTTYRGSGKTFVLQHWEGDWAIRRGSPKPFDASYVPSATAVKGMIDWLNARQAGIVQARAEIRDTDVHVYGATEVNRVKDSMAGRQGVANSVLPYTTVDLVSYSCYESLDSSQDLSEAIEFLASHLPPTAAFGQNPHSVYLGEFGYPENGRGGMDVVNQRLNVVFDVVKQKELPWAAYWEIYCNEQTNNAVTAPLNGKQNDLNVRGYWMVKPDGSPGMAWHRYRRLLAAQEFPSDVKEVIHDHFDRADGADLGPGWSQTLHYGVVHETLAHGRLRFDIPSGHAIPWGSATLDLGAHTLLPGDGFSVTLRRVGQQGGFGVELFDSDQLRVGSGFDGGPSPLEAWNGTTWTPISFDDRGRPVLFDWNAPHIMGVHFVFADGHRTTFNFYIDGHYAGSWLIHTANRRLQKIGVYAQARADGAAFEFGDLKTYGWTSR